ncbi:hypothetical protein I79_000175 [Cricetulus griseus]|uniref:Uncharacterized protein n=1 Tax=Cricetulus griseus TaxID=10029 RepID=G3GRM3_CRIGR|nr:hypothetical protein I79_000175 [Cricetulus griseus]
MTKNLSMTKDNSRNSCLDLLGFYRHPSVHMLTQTMIMSRNFSSHLPSGPQGLH